MADELTEIVMHINNGTLAGFKKDMDDLLIQYTTAKPANMELGQAIKKAEETFGAEGFYKIVLPAYQNHNFRKVMQWIDNLHLLQPKDLEDAFFNYLLPVSGKDAFELGGYLERRFGRNYHALVDLYKESLGVRVMEILDGGDLTRLPGPEGRMEKLLSESVGNTPRDAVTKLTRAFGYMAAQMMGKYDALQKA